MPRTMTDLRSLAAQALAESQAEGSTLREIAAQALREDMAVNPVTAFGMGTVQGAPTTFGNVARFAQAGLTAVPSMIQAARAVPSALGGYVADSIVGAVEDPMGTIMGTRPTGSSVPFGDAMDAAAAPQVVDQVAGRVTRPIANAAGNAAAAGGAVGQALDARYQPMLQSGASRTGYSLGQSTTPMVANLGATAVGGLVGGPAGAMAAGGLATFVSEGGSTTETIYRDLQAQGVSEDEALTMAFATAVPAGAAKAAIEQGVGMQPIIAGVFRPLAQRMGVAAPTFRAAVMKYLGAAGLEGVEEVTQGTVDRFARSEVTGQGPTPFSREALPDIAQEALLGTAGGLLFGAPGVAADTARARQAAIARQTPQPVRGSESQNAQPRTEGAPNAPIDPNSSTISNTSPTPPAAGGMDAAERSTLDANAGPAATSPVPPGSDGGVDATDARIGQLLERLQSGAPMTPQERTALRNELAQISGDPDYEAPIASDTGGSAASGGGSVAPPEVLGAADNQQLLGVGEQLGSGDGRIGGVDTNAPGVSARSVDRVVSGGVDANGSPVAGSGGVLSARSAETSLAAIADMSGAELRAQAKAMGVDDRGPISAVRRRVDMAASKAQLPVDPQSPAVEAQTNGAANASARLGQESSPRSVSSAGVSEMRNAQTSQSPSTQADSVLNTTPRTPVRLPAQSPSVEATPRTPQTPQVAQGSSSQNPTPTPDGAEFAISHPKDRHLTARNKSVISQMLSRGAKSAKSGITRYDIEGDGPNYTVRITTREANDRGQVSDRARTTPFSATRRGLAPAAPVPPTPAPTPTPSAAQPAASSQQSRTQGESQAARAGAVSLDPNSSDAADIADIQRATGGTVRVVPATTPTQKKLETRMKGLGRRVVFVEDSSGKFNGAASTNDSRTVYVRADADDATAVPTVAHELLHAVAREAPDVVEKVVGTVSGERLAQARAKYRKRLAEAFGEDSRVVKNFDANETLATEEAVAQIIEDAAAGDTEAARALYETPGLLQRLRQIVRKLLDRMGIKRLTPEERSLIRLLDTLEKNAEDGQRASISWASNRIATNAEVRRRAGNSLEMQARGGGRESLDARAGAFEREGLADAVTQGWDTATMFAFKGPFPGEVRSFLQGKRPQVRRLFSQNNPIGTGADALGGLGDEAYFSLATQEAGVSDPSQAIDALRNDPDPENQMVAAVAMAARETGKTNPKVPILAASLQPGDIVKINDKYARVLKDEEERMVLVGQPFRGIYLEGLRTIPVDKNGYYPEGTRRNVEAVQAMGSQATDVPSGGASGAVLDPDVPFSPRALPDRIDVDGVSRPTTNADGRQIAQNEEATRAFWRWFGNSRVVDAEGRPKVLYHGTNKEFTQFIPQDAMYGKGVYLAESRNRAELYGDKVLEVYASIKSVRPSAEPKDGYKTGAGDWLAKNPEQIKSATGNRGTFDPNNADIRFAPRSMFDRTDDAKGTASAQGSLFGIPADAVAKGPPKLTEAERAELFGPAPKREMGFLDEYPTEQSFLDSYAKRFAERGQYLTKQDREGIKRDYKVRSRLAREVRDAVAKRAGNNYVPGGSRAEVLAEYPGIRVGESVAKYEKRMGTSDTPVMFAPRAPEAFDPDNIPKGVARVMFQKLKAQGYDVRSVDDMLGLGRKRLAAGGKVNADWVAAYDAAKGSQTKATATRQAATDEKAKWKNVNWARIRELGYTNDPREAGYITPDGKMIDLSGKNEGGTRGERGLDHREAGGTVGMQELMASGYVRWMPESNGIDLVVMPNNDQIRVLETLIRRANGEVIVDIDDGLGEMRDGWYMQPRRNWQAEYPEGTKPAKVIGDIRRFYAGEDLPQTDVRFAPKGTSRIEQRGAEQAQREIDRGAKKLDSEKAKAESARVEARATIGVLRTQLNAAIRREKGLTKVVGILETMRARQENRADDATAENQARAQAMKQMRESQREVEKVKNELVRIVRAALPKAMHGQFITDIQTIRSRSELPDVVAEIERKVLDVRADELQAKASSMVGANMVKAGRDAREIERRLGNAGQSIGEAALTDDKRLDRLVMGKPLRKLTGDERESAKRLIRDVLLADRDYGRAKTIEARQTALDNLQRSVEMLGTIIKDRREADALVKKGQRRSLAKAIATLKRQIGTFAVRAQMNRLGQMIGQERSNMMIDMADAFNLARMIDGGKLGPFRRLVIDPLLQGMRDFTVTVNAVYTKADGHARTAGFEDFDDAMRQLGGSYGESSTLTYKLGTAIGGRTDLQAWQALKLYAMDQETLAQTLGAEGRQWHWDKDGDGFNIDYKQYDALLKAIPEEHKAFVDAMKRERDALFEAFAAMVKLLTGIEPPKVFGYDIHRVLPRWLAEFVTVDAAVLEGTNGHVIQTLENVGLGKARTSTKAPLLVTNFLDDWRYTIDQQARVTHLATPVRNAKRILKDSSLQADITKRINPKIIGRFMGTSEGQNRQPGIIDDVAGTNQKTPSGKLDRAVIAGSRNASKGFTSLSYTSMLNNLGGLATLWASMPTRAWADGMAGLATTRLSDVMEAVPFVMQEYGRSAYLMKSVATLEAQAKGSRRPGTLAQMRRSGAAIGNASKELVGSLRDIRSNPALVGDTARRTIKEIGGGVGSLLDGVPLLHYFASRPAVVAYAGWKAEAKRLGKDDAWVAMKVEESLTGTQGQANPMMMTGYQSRARGTWKQGVFTFINDSVRMHNMVLEAALEGDKKKLAKASAAILFNLMWVPTVRSVASPAGIAIILAAATGGLGDIDKEEWEKLKKQMAATFGTTFARDFFGTLAPGIGDRLVELGASPFVDDPLGTPFSSLTQGISRAVKQVGGGILEAIEGDDGRGKTAREKITTGAKNAMLDSVTVTTGSGAPTLYRQMNRWWEEIAADEE